MALSTAWTVVKKGVEAVLVDRGLVCHTTHLVFASIWTLLVAADAEGRRGSRTDRVYPLEAKMGRVSITGVGTGADVLVLGHGNARPAREGIPKRHGGRVRLFADGGVKSVRYTTLRRTGSRYNRGKEKSETI